MSFKVDISPELLSRIASGNLELETGHNPFFPRPFRRISGNVDAVGRDLRVVDDGLGAMASVGASLENNGAGVDEFDVLYENSVCVQKGVVVVRGRGCEILDRFLKSDKNALPCEEIPNRLNVFEVNRGNRKSRR
jgi:hypothetical protein